MYEISEYPAYQEFVDIMKRESMPSGAESVLNNPSCIIPVGGAY
jgi:hypothetical protein